MKYAAHILKQRRLSLSMIRDYNICSKFYNDPAMFDPTQQELLDRLENTLSEIMENVCHPVHDPKHLNHTESLAAFNQLLTLREQLIFAGTSDD